jgi:hypothetical protein
MASAPPTVRLGGNGPALIVTPYSRPLLYVILIGGLPMAALGGFLTASAEWHFHYGGLVVALFGGISAFSVVLVVWLGFVIATFYAIELTSDGVRLFTRNIKGAMGVALETVPWEDLGPMEAPRGLQGLVWMEAGGRPLGLAPIQARAIALDPRYPSHRSLPQAVQASLGL